MENSIEQYSNSGWNNQAICLNFALDNIEPNYQTLYNLIVKLSFGYKKLKTNKITIDELALKSKLGRRTVIRHMAYLVENKFVEAIHPKHNPKGGGSEAYEYAPDFPRGYGHIKFEDDIKKSSNTKSKVPDKEEVTSYKNKGKNYEF